MRDQHCYTHSTISQVALKKKVALKTFRVDLQCCILFYILFYYGLFG